MCVSAYVCVCVSMSMCVRVCVYGVCGDCVCTYMHVFAHAHACVRVFVRVEERSHEHVCKTLIMVIYN